MSEHATERELLHLLQRLENIMSTVPAGLASLQAEITKLEATAASIVATIQALSQPSTEDAAVAAAAQQVDQINATLTAAIPAPPAA